MQYEVIDKNSVIPIYHQLYKYLERQIRGGYLKPGDTLPTEVELVRCLWNQPHDIRRAISELAAADLIYAQKGRGAFVAKPKLDNVVFDLNNFYDEIKQQEDHDASCQAFRGQSDQGR